MVGALTDALGERVVRDEVISVRRAGGAVEVRGGGTTDHFERVVVAAGRGTAHLVRTMGLSMPVTHAAHVRLTFRVRDRAPERPATLQDSSGEFGEVGVYAAAVPGNGAYAVGLSGQTAAREDGSLLSAEELARGAPSRGPARRP